MWWVEGKLKAYAKARGRARVTKAQERNGIQNAWIERRLNRSGRKMGSPWIGCDTVLVENLGMCNYQVSTRSRLIAIPGMFGE